MTYGHLLYDRPEETILSLEAALILRQEAVKIVKEHPYRTVLSG